MLENLIDLIKISFFRFRFKLVDSKKEKSPGKHQAGTKKAPSRHQVGAKKALSKVELKILEFCKSPKGLAEILDHFGYTDRTKFKARYVNPLLDEGLLEMTDPASPKSPKQQYQTTKFGMSYLEGKRS